MSVELMGYYLGAPVGALLAGWLSDLTSIHSVYLATAGILIIIMSGEQSDAKGICPVKRTQTTGRLHLLKIRHLTHNTEKRQALAVQSSITIYCITRRNLLEAID